eukprot:sb/3474390/
MFGMVDISLPDFIYIYPVNPDSLRPTRQNMDIIERRDVATLTNSSDARSHVLNGSFFYRTTILWNKLPYEVRLALLNYSRSRLWDTAHQISDRFDWCSWGLAMGLVSKNATFGKKRKKTYYCILARVKVVLCDDDMGD